MTQLPFVMVQRISQFSARMHRTIREPLGAGKDGTVFSTSRATALKLIDQTAVYRRERDAYLRLRERRVANVNGFDVPLLASFHDDILAIEITIVRRPFVLDFASVYLDEPPDFPEEVLNESRERIEELFGDRASEVFSLLHTLAQKHGIHMLDARPANIQF